MKLAKLEAPSVPACKLINRVKTNLFRNGRVSFLDSLETVLDLVIGFRALVGKEILFLSFKKYY